MNSNSNTQAFYEDLFNMPNELLKDYLKLKLSMREDLLGYVGKLMLVYTISDCLMNLSDEEKNKELSILKDMLLINQLKKSKKEQTKAINDILKTTTRATFDYYKDYSGYTYNYKNKDVEEIIKHHYKGNHFSNRVWDNEKEVNTEMYNLMKKFIDGKINVNEIKKVIDKKYSKSIHNTKRLVDTEVARCSNEAFTKFCEEVGVEELLYNSVLENNTCDSCRQYDGKVFKFGKEPKIPQHPSCKCFYEIKK